MNRPSLAAALLIGASILPASAQTLEKLARDYASDRTPARRTALVRYAAAHPAERNGALAHLALAHGDLQEKRYEEALEHLRKARPRLAVISDHIAFLSATAAFELGDDAATLRFLEVVEQHREAPSPFSGRSALLAARAHTRRAEPDRALATLQQRYAWLPQPAGDLALALAFEAASDPLNAVPRYQAVFYGFPLAAEAAEAGRALDRLASLLGDRFPPPMPEAVLNRGGKLLDGRRYAGARTELISWLPKLSGADAELARIRIAAALYGERNTSEALDLLRGLRAETPDLDAQRLYWVVQCARRLEDVQAMDGALADLEQRHPTSRWRLEALVSAGNYHLLAGRAAAAEPLYRTCYQAFAGSDRAPYCHWKVAFGTYLARTAAASEMLREHIRLYPASEKTAAALYFLGRLSEAASDFGGARAFFAQLEREYQGTYYALLAQERMRAAGVRAAVPSNSALEFLRSVAFPRRTVSPQFRAGPEKQLRLERGRLLASAALDIAAETELVFGARNEEQGEIYALELARIASRRQRFDQAIRYIKAHAPGYLRYPPGSAPAEFWRLAFPLPWADSLRRHSRSAGLDPYLVAALARQESEWDPRAVSAANAHGLTQILPSTGRELARRHLRGRRFRAESLFNPDINLHLGTAYLSRLIAGLDGNVHAALAAYNAGRTRVVRWLRQVEYREPAEFVESIPITETRNYVQIVLRNAAMYRRLYGSSHPTARATPTDE